MEGQTVGTDRRARTGGAFVDLRPPKPPEVPHSPPKLPEDIQNLGVLGADTQTAKCATWLQGLQLTTVH